MTITREYREVGGLWERHYVLSIRESGEVTLRCKIGIKDLGKPERWKVPSELVAHLLENIRETQLLEKGGTIGKMAHNTSGEFTSSTISLAIGGISKTVERHIGSADGLSPEEEKLAKLEQQIVQAGGAEQRIRECCFPGYTGPLP